MRFTARVLLVASLFATCAAIAQDTVAPPPALLLENVPAIPAELAQKLKAYNDFRPHGLFSWHPARREMLVSRRLTGTTQVHRVADPGATPEPLTDFQDAVNDALYPPAGGDYFIFVRGQGGNEVFRYFRYDVATKAITARKTPSVPFNVMSDALRSAGTPPSATPTRSMPAA